MGGGDELRKRMAALQRQEAHAKRQNDLREQRRLDRERAARPRTSRLEQFRHTRWFRAGEWALGAVGVAMTLVGGIYGIFGPIWPTEPTFVPGAPSFGSALYVPFIVTNKSILFPIKKMQIFCSAYRIDVGGFSFRGFAFTVPGYANLAPAESRSYTCAFNQAARGFEKEIVSVATIALETEYDSILPWKSRVRTTSGKFTLNTKTSPPQWVPGEPI
jgi:hypothetical protein